MNYSPTHTNPATHQNNINTSPIILATLPIQDNTYVRLIFT